MIHDTHENDTRSVVDVPALRGGTHVFQDRAHAGAVLAELLDGYDKAHSIIAAIPAGGVPVAVALSDRLRIPLTVVVVSKITFAWNTEAGYGAVAFDGTVRLNERLMAQVGLDQQQVDQDITRTKSKVIGRVTELAGGEPPPVAQRNVIIVDDGVASGFTLRTAIEALDKCDVRSIVVATPTGLDRSVRELAESVEMVYCANLRSGPIFAVADAYQRWTDVSDDQVIDLLNNAQALRVKT